MAPGIALGFVNVHFPVVVGFLILHLAKYGNAGPTAFSTYALVILLSRFFLGGLPDRIPPGITYYGGLLAMAVGLSVLAIGPRPALAIGATAILGFGFSFPWSSIVSTILRKIPSGERGSAEQCECKADQSHAVRLASPVPHFVGARLTRDSRGQGPLLRYPCGMGLLCRSAPCARGCGLAVYWGKCATKHGR